MEKIEVKKAKLYEEDGQYYIDVTYLYENDRVITEIRIPKIDIPLTDFSGHVDSHVIDPPYPYRGFPRVEHRICLGGLSMSLRDKNGVAYEERIIEEKTQEMTLEEIEKKLGHKIKIVTKK